MRRCARHNPGISTPDRKGRKNDRIQSHIYHASVIATGPFNTSCIVKEHIQSPHQIIHKNPTPHQNPTTAKIPTIKLPLNVPAPLSPTSNGLPPPPNASGFVFASSLLCASLVITAFEPSFTAVVVKVDPTFSELVVVVESVLAALLPPMVRVRVSALPAESVVVIVE